MDSPYTIDVDVQLLPGRGYAASYVISGPDGSVVHHRLIARRFTAYSEAMACAIDAASATAASLSAPVLPAPRKISSPMARQLNVDTIPLP